MARLLRTTALWRLTLLAIGLLFALSGPARAGLTIRVQGNRLLDDARQPVRLLGVDFSGAEYACIQGKGIWSGPADQATVAAMVSWHIDAVRISLNEDCWLGIDGAPAAYSGAAYRQAIHEFVQQLHEAGLYAILDLHWNAPGATLASSLQPMADADHAPDFWRSVAASFRADPAVLFDLYSEPHDIDWECWRSGCTIDAGEATAAWQTAGMQSLVDAVRSQGATQPLLLGGLEWANDLNGWLEHLPSDPENQLVASIHVYPNNGCNTAACWSAQYAPVAVRHPIVAGEIGEFDCAHGFIDQFMQWADANGVSYLGWSWNAYDCAAGPSLIADAQGTPTAFGEGLRDHLTETSPSTVNSPPEPQEPPTPPPPSPPPAGPTAPVKPLGPALTAQSPAAPAASALSPSSSGASSSGSVTLRHAMPRSSLITAKRTGCRAASRVSRTRARKLGGHASKTRATNARKPATRQLKLRCPAPRPRPRRGAAGARLHRDVTRAPAAFGRKSHA